MGIINNIRRGQPSIMGYNILIPYRVAHMDIHTHDFCISHNRSSQCMANTAP